MGEGNENANNHDTLGEDNPFYSSINLDSLGGTLASRFDDHWHQVLRSCKLGVLSKLLRSRYGRYS